MTVVLRPSARFRLADIPLERATVGCSMHLIRPAIDDARGKVPDIDVTDERLPTCAGPRQRHDAREALQAFRASPCHQDRHLICPAAEAREAGPLPFPVFTVADELKEADGLRRPDELPTADGANIASLSRLTWLIAATTPRLASTLRGGPMPLRLGISHAAG
jgi:hypothetical protein